MDKTDLRWCDTIDTDLASTQSWRLLLENVFGSFKSPDNILPTWTASGFFTADETCIATIETVLLPLAFAREGAKAIEMAGAIRRVAVHPDWRGQGLFRQLMDKALTRLAEGGAACVMLYTETPDLYRRFGFNLVAQHAFVGPPPSPTGSAGFRPITGSDLAPASIMRRFADREPLSDCGALMGTPALFLERLAADDDIQLAMIGDEALVAYEIEGDRLTIVDIVAPSIPSLATILGAMRRPFRTVKTLFPPDKLGWAGTAIDDDTGLMISGTIPIATRFPPTTEF